MIFIHNKIVLLFSVGSISIGKNDVHTRWHYPHTKTRVGSISIGKMKLIP